MPSRLRIAVLTAVLAAGTTLAAEAQTSRAHLGPRISYNFDAEEVGLGAQVGLPLGRRLEFYPSFDVFFVDPGSLWALNADLKYRFGGEGMDWLYTGAGLNVTNASFDGNDQTDAGLNLLLGVESLRGWVHPFAEGRLTIGDESAFQLSGGLNFTLGQH
jgi:hypothetical protein